jgi:hypothetical protein
VFIGLAVTSHDNTRLCAPSFDHVSLTGGVSQPPSTPTSPNPASGATGVSVNPTLTWTSSGATSYDVRFGTSNPPAQTISGQSAASYQPSTLANATTYFWQIVAHNTDGSATGPVWSFTTASGGGTGLPSPWTDSDIGAVGVVGSASFSNGTFSVTGSGADIWNNADAFHFASMPLVGDGQLVARVVSVQNASTWSKAGVMIRESLTANSSHAFALVSAAKGVALQWRPSTGASSLNATGSASAPPRWIRLQRNGSTFTASESADGSTWTAIGSASITMGSTVYAGLAVTSHTTSAATTAVLDHVSP